MHDNISRSEFRTKSKYKFDNSSSESVEQFKYLETTLKNQNYNQEELKSLLMSGNAYYHSVQNLLSSILLPKNVNNFACCWV